MKFKVIIHEAEEGGYWAEVPALPGCFSQAETIDEMHANIREAIECHLDVPMPEMMPERASIQKSKYESRFRQTDVSHPQAPRLDTCPDAKFPFYF